MEKTRPKMTRGTAVIIIVTLAIIAAAAVVVRGMPSGVQSGLQSFIDVSTQNGRQRYLENLGWQIDLDTEQSTKVVIPDEFDDVMAEYNKLQKQQGFDMSVYAGLSCVQYTYKVKNYPDGGEVLATLYVQGKRVIGGDIHSCAFDGFMHALK